MNSKRTVLFLLLFVVFSAVLIVFFVDLDTAARFINGLLMVTIPLLLAAFIIRRFSSGWRIWGIGAVTFLVSQVLHIPFNKWLLEPFMAWLGWNPEPCSWKLAGIGLLAGLSAGFFEETARLAVYKHWLVKSRSWRDGVLFGAGHGGCEAILLGLLVLAGFFQMLALQEATPESLIGMVPPDQIEATLTSIQAYWSTPWNESLLGCLERVSAIIVQISLSLLVLQVFRRENYLWYWLAVLWHTVVDMTAVFGIFSWGVYIVEAILLVLAVISLGIIFALRHDDPPADEVVQPASDPPAMAFASPLDITFDKLEDSRYD